MKTILVPVDLSTTASQVMDAAVDLARSLQGRIVLLHVVQPPVITSDYGIGMENLEELVAVSEKTASKRLSTMKEHYAKEGLEVDTLQSVGAPVAVILDEAKNTQAAYIVMGSHGHSAFYDLLVGTTTHGILKNAKCPVLIIPPKHR